MIDETKIKAYQDLQAEKSELEIELRRIDGFFARSADNQDNARAINKGKIDVKFAGTMVKLPEGIFTGALNTRKAEITQRLSDITSELEAL